jgi:hypothetical protein
METGDPVRLRLHDDTARIGRVARICDHVAKRDGIAFAVELDTGSCVHLADIAAIAPTPREDPGANGRDPRLAKCAHALGYRGHCLTKSRRYSTTFKQLRADREAWVHQQILARSRDATQRALASAEERTVRLEVDGIGHVTAADQHYALAEYARARERRRVGREEHCDQPPRTDQQGNGRPRESGTPEHETRREAAHDEREHDGGVRRRRAADEHAHR